MAKAIYDVQVPNIGEVERALGDMRDKAPRAMKTLSTRLRREPKT